MDIRKFTTIFIEAEVNLKLFKLKTNGINWWDIVRHDIYYEIFFKLNGKTINENQDSRLFKRIYNFSLRIYLTLRLKFLSFFFKYDLIILRSPRLKINIKKYIDPILDDIILSLNTKPLIIDQYPHSFPYFCSKKDYVGTSILNDVVLIEKYFLKKFNKKFDLKHFIIKRVNFFFNEKKYYLKFFKYLNPKIIIMSSNGAQKSLFYCAKINKIKVIEAQHGLINLFHPLYSYPDIIKKGSLKTLPDVLLTFSDYWNYQAHFPVSKIYSIGNNHKQIKKNNKNSKNVLFVGANIYEDVIDDMLTKASCTFKQINFFYKLHHNQFHYSKKIEKIYKNYPNIKVINDQKSAEQLLEDCFLLVCIQSTLVYQALDVGINICIIRDYDYHVHHDIFNHNKVSIVKDIHELNKILNNRNLLDNVLISRKFISSYDSEIIKKLFK